MAAPPLRARKRLRAPFRAHGQPTYYLVPKLPAAYADMPTFRAANDRDCASGGAIGKTLASRRRSAVAFESWQNETRIPLRPRLVADSRGPLRSNQSDTDLRLHRRSRWTFCNSHVQISFRDARRVDHERPPDSAVLFWIDMEGALRTEDLFEMSKCWRVCEIVYR